MRFITLVQRMSARWPRLLVGVFMFCGLSAHAQTSLDSPTKPLSHRVSGQFTSVAILTTLPSMGDKNTMSLAAAEAASGVFPEPLTFAQGHEMAVEIAASSDWQMVAQPEGQIAVWRKRIVSDGLSLNIGFSDFYMPVGGELFIYSVDGNQILGPYTEAQNKDHGELWTPLIESSEAIIEVNVPVSVKHLLRLNISKISQGFLDLKNAGALKSGSCNVDVVCSQGDEWRDQIRSVGRYIHSGVFTCTGAAINTAGDTLRRFFLTADHCGMNESEAPSVVVYWNYENSVCRVPGSSASGGNGDGDNQNVPVNMGSTFRADFSTSDMTLIELNDPFPEAADVFLAGWDRRDQSQTSAVAIHHPNFEEKRISFEEQPTQITDYLSSNPNTSGTHIRVVDWDLGTTEPGSSGSPLFDENKRIVGQLHGGFAACGNDSSDWYGRLFRSWSGGGTSNSRLSDWLDPNQLGDLFVDGLNADGSGASGGGNSNPIFFMVPPLFLLLD